MTVSSGESAFQHRHLALKHARQIADKRVSTMGFPVMRFTGFISQGSC